MPDEAKKEIPCCGTCWFVRPAKSNYKDATSYRIL